MLALRRSHDKLARLNNYYGRSRNYHSFEIGNVCEGSQK